MILKYPRALEAIDIISGFNHSVVPLTSLVPCIWANNTFIFSHTWRTLSVKSEFIHLSKFWIPGAKVPLSSSHFPSSFRRSSSGFSSGYAARCSGMRRTRACVRGCSTVVIFRYLTRVNGVYRAREDRTVPECGFSNAVWLHRVELSRHLAREGGVDLITRPTEPRREGHFG